ncbi:hypothetical protein JST56_03955 [Candidatus Dependentiae bacterium]|nr:hypothetical protein [Candidatus Dependentiae bacterium]
MKKEEFQNHVHKFHMRCSTHLGTLQLLQGKKDKILNMVDTYLQAIIEKRAQANNTHNNANN